MEVNDIDIIHKDLEYFVDDVLKNEPVENQQKLFDNVSNGSDKISEILHILSCINNCKKKLSLVKNQKNEEQC